MLLYHSLTSINTSLENELQFVYIIYVCFLSEYIVLLRIKRFLQLAQSELKSIIFKSVRAGKLAKRRKKILAWEDQLLHAGYASRPTDCQQILRHCGLTPDLGLMKDLGLRTLLSGDYYHTSILWSELFPAFAAFYYWASF